MGHYRDYKHPTSIAKIEDGMQKHRTKYFSRTGKDYPKKRMDTFSVNINNFNFYGAEEKLAPLGRIKSPTYSESTSTFQDDLLEHKNIFSMDNDNDISELSLREAMGEPMRYIYQKQGSTIYEPVETVLKKASKFAGNKDNARQRTRDLINKLNVTDTLDQNITPEYMKMRFAPSFQQALNKYATDSKNKKDIENYVNRLSQYGGTRDTYHGVPIDLITSQNIENSKRLKSKIAARLKARIARTGKIFTNLW